MPPFRHWKPLQFMWSHDSPEKPGLQEHFVPEHTPWTHLKPRYNLRLITPTKLYKQVFKKQTLFMLHQSYKFVFYNLCSLSDECKIILTQSFENISVDKNPTKVILKGFLFHIMTEFVAKFFHLLRILNDVHTNFGTTLQKTRKVKKISSYIPETTSTHLIMASIAIKTFIANTLLIIITQAM